jgi:flagellin-like protein
MKVLHTDERAQVGIGTLIVFIAMVLVAAIAAGVLLNTAGLLQTQAESTGQESTRQVTNNLQVISKVGYNIAGDSGIGDKNANISPRESGDFFSNDTKRIYRINMVVQKAAGASSIDMTQATIEYFGDKAATLTHYDDNGTIIYQNNGTLRKDGQFNSTANDTFLTYDVRGGDSTLKASDDRIGLTVLLGDYNDSSMFSTTGNLSQPAPLKVGQEIQLRYTTPSGSQKFIVLRVPKILGKDTVVAL